MLAGAITSRPLLAIDRAAVSSAAAPAPSLITALPDASSFHSLQGDVSELGTALERQTMAMARVSRPCSLVHPLRFVSAFAASSSRSTDVNPFTLLDSCPWSSASPYQPISSTILLLLRRGPSIRSSERRSLPITSALCRRALCQAYFLARAGGAPVCVDGKATPTALTLSVASPSYSFRPVSPLLSIVRAHITPIRSSSFLLALFSPDTQSSAGGPPSRAARRVELCANQVLRHSMLLSDASTGPGGLRSCRHLCAWK